MSRKRTVFLSILFVFIYSAFCSCGIDKANKVEVIQIQLTESQDEDRENHEETDQIFETKGNSIVSNIEHLEIVSLQNELIFRFSRESGIYDEKFELTIEAPTDEIYYTLDGSLPNKESIKYTGNIEISEINDYRLALEKQISGGYYCLEDTEYQKRSYYKTDLDSIKNYNGWVVRAIYYDEQDNASDIITGFYKVVSEPSKCYTVSIITEPDNLIDYYSGIMVLGEGFDVWKTIDLRWYEDNPWRWWRGNFRKKGKDWEREGHVSIYDNENTLIFDSETGIRIKGNMSRGLAQKSFNLYFHKEYGSEAGYLFPNGYTAKKITLDACAGDGSKLQDKIVADLCRNMNFSGLNYFPAKVFINGEYWGFYELTEKYDEKYFSYYYDVEKNEVVIIKNGSVEEGKENDIYEYKTDIRFISYCDLNDADNWNKVCQLFDINSLIDYFAVQTYINNSDGDWPKGNIALWKTRKKDSNLIYGDGRWRWILFDLNGGVIMDNLYVDTDTIDYLIKSSAMFKNLWTVDDFREKFFCKLRELEEIFSRNTTRKYIENYRNLYLEELQKSYNRFFDLDTSVIEKKLDNIILFFENRGAIIEELIAKYDNQ